MWNMLQMVCETISLPWFRNKVTAKRKLKYCNVMGFWTTTNKQNSKLQALEMTVLKDILDLIIHVGFRGRDWRQG